MARGWRRGRRHPLVQGSGFTLIELLTVMAIVGILATLIASTLGSAKKASQRARCISNLHQISVALQLYIDDFEKRPPALTGLFTSGHLASREVLMCPADKYGGWGSLVQPRANVFTSEIKSDTEQGATITTGDARATIVLSYLHPLDWDDETWQLLNKKGTQAGIAACQLHGLGHPNPDAPSLYDFQGLVLRAQLDGAVVRRQVFWGLASADNPPPSDRFNALLPAEVANPEHPWQLFSDEPIP